MNDAELRSLERLCSKDDLSDSNVATLTVLGLAAATEIMRLLGELEHEKREHETTRILYGDARRDRDAYADVYAVAAVRLRRFPVELDDHLAIVDAVDACRNTLESDDA